jgi:hypothetical protein
MRSSSIVKIFVLGFISSDTLEINQGQIFYNTTTPHPVIGLSFPSNYAFIDGGIYTNGAITASGGISASGNLLIGHITASGDISASGTIYGKQLILSGGNGIFTSASLAGAIANQDNLGNHTATQNLDLSNNDIININIVTSSKLITGHITSSLLSSSGLLFASLSQDLNNSDSYKTVVYDTITGRFYHTGSYGGGGGSTGVTSIIAGPNITIQGGSPGTGAVTISSSAGGGLWSDVTNGIELATSADNVGVGTSPSSIHKLLVDGNGVFTGDVVAYYTSDKRLKDNIKPIEDPIGKIKQIGGYSFDWNDKQNTYEGTDFGVIAQEIEKVLPSLVQTREDGFKGVKYDKIVSLLIEAVKDQQKQIDELKKLI